MALLSRSGISSPEILLASTARTVNTVTGVVNLMDCTGVSLVLNITAASGTGGLRIQYALVDPIDKTTYEWSYILGTAKTSTGLIVASIAPGVRDDNTHFVHPTIAKPMNGFAKFAVIHSDASSYTYQLAMIRLP